MGCCPVTLGVRSMCFQVTHRTVSKTPLSGNTATGTARSSKPRMANILCLPADSATFWHTRWNADQRQPHSITVDMGKTNHIGGLMYLPRHDGLLNGVVEKYRFETSADGVNWKTNVANGSFANIQNNPSLQEVSFAPVKARYFRFTSLRAIWGSGWTSAAEISVLPAL